MSDISVQYDPYYAPLSSTEMAMHYSHAQQVGGEVIHLGPKDTQLVITWFVNGQLDKLKLERWQGPPGERK